VEGWNNTLKDYMKKKQVFLGDIAGGQINIISDSIGRDKLSWKAELVEKLLQLIDDKIPSRDCQDRRNDVEGQFFC